MLCGGNKLEYCGGANRLNTYQSNATATSSGVSSSAASTVASSSTAPTPSGPVIVPGNVNFQYAGCYVEPANTRALSTLVTAGDQMTIELCLGSCAQYAYAGVEYARYDDSALLLMWDGELTIAIASAGVATP